MKFLKKGQMSNSLMSLVIIGVLFVVFGVSLAIGQGILGQIREDQRTTFGGNTTAWNSTGSSQAGIQTLTGQTNNLALIAILTVIVAALFGALGFILARRGGSIQ